MNSQQMYFIKRRADGLWWDGEGWNATTAKKLTEAAAGTKLSELPGGMVEGTYKLVRERKDESVSS